MSDTNSTPNLQPQDLKSGNMTPLQGTRSRSRDEVRAGAGHKSTSERAAMFRERITSARAAAENTAEVEPAESPSTTPSPEPVAPEEVASDSPPVDVDAASVAPESDLPVPETLADFATQLGLEPDVLDELLVTQKVNGEERQLALREALQNSQFATANHERAQRLAAAERQHEAAVKEQVQQYSTWLKEAKAGHLAAFNVLQTELQSPEVTQLKQSDPAAYVQWQDLTNRRLGELRASFDQLLAHEQQVLGAHRQELRKAGIARLREQIADYDTAERQDAIKHVFESFGANENEVAAMLGRTETAVIDDRIVLLAAKYADAQKRIAELEAKTTETARRAKQVVDQASSARASAPRNPDKDSRKRIDDAKKAIKGKKGYNGRRAKQQAILTAIQENRRRRG